MQKRVLTILASVLMFSLVSLVAADKPTPRRTSPGGVPDKAYMQKIWDGWSTLDPSKVAQYYAQGPHAFFDIAPVKYASWDEYQAGVVKTLADFKSAVCTVNDDAAIHPHGDLAWGTATVKMDATMKSGKREMATLRWTVVFEKQKDGKWLIVHEHVSEPLP